MITPLQFLVGGMALVLVAYLYDFKPPREDTEQRAHPKKAKTVRIVDPFSEMKGDEQRGERWDVTRDYCG